MKDVHDFSVAHVLFSSMTYYLALVERFGDKETFPLVIDALGKSEVHPVIVDTFYSTYQINKS
ncbi:hypothetical protein [Vibrio thalassae]|uniref:hypothetical protein n=1 Tax=Vibrio thalassae TaxID=1243014 RepID=UPI0013052423|nr:hypothetical protein [Vibrio thalassae]